MKPLLVLLFFVSMCDAASQPITLQYNLRTGSSWNFRQVEEISALAQTNDGRSTRFERKTTRYLTLSIDEAGMSGVLYTFLQDTAVVEDKDFSTPGQQPDLENILTRKPVQVRISPSGKIESTTPLVPLRVDALLGTQGGDAMFAQRAAILPVLPTRELRVGDTWTETTSDTLYPSKELPNYGRGTGVRNLESATTYNIDGKETKNGIECLKIRWLGSVFMEEKILFSSLEEFSEDNTTIEGTMHIAIATGMPIEVEVRTEKESTRALFGDQSTVVPTSVSSITTLDFIPQ